MLLDKRHLLEMEACLSFEEFYFLGNRGTVHVVYKGYLHCKNLEQWKGCMFGKGRVAR